jgi:hypothetical protein
MIKTTIYITGIVLIIQFSNFAQQFGKGVLLNESTPAKMLVSASLMRGDYLNLADRFSLKRFAPTPGNQGIYSTCAGWACSYSARTILNSIKNNYIQPLIDDNAFSPSYIYNQIRKDSSCENAVFLHEALDIMKEQGVLPIKDFGYECERQIQSQEKYKAGMNKILEYREIFNRYSSNKILATKKSISEFKPVVIAIDIPGSFERSGEIWNPQPSDYKEWRIGHALVVIGYDDTLSGGSFEVINSWGTEWGKNGFCWIRYKDFDFFTYSGYEIIDQFISPEIDYNLSGTLTFLLENGQPIELKKNEMVFQTIAPYPSGTKFNVILSNDQPAFVYSFGSDLKKKITPIFPANSKISPLLPYKKNNIPIPNEYSNLMLDETTGKTYFCFIYSSKKVDIEDAFKKIKKGKGSFQQRVYKYFQQDLVNDFKTQLVETNKVELIGKNAGDKMIIVIVEIDHIGG